MTTRTGASLGNLDVTEHIEPVPRERHTYCATDQVENPSLRAAMSFFDDSLGAPMRPCFLILNSCLNSSSAQGPGIDQRSFAERSAELELLLDGISHVAVRRLILVTGSPGVGKSVLASAILAGQFQESDPSLESVFETSDYKFDDVVDVVRDLQRRLGIDLKDVLAAASIKPRTYHSWARPSAPRPRLTSQGRLWALAQLVDDLLEVLNVPIRQWLLADSNRLTALRAGRFDELLEQASQERMQQDSPDTVASPFHGVGEDSPLSLRTTSRGLIIDEQAITEPVLPPRRPPELPQI